MKNSTILIIFAVLIIVLITFKKPINMALSRGYRNNNPGNIRLTYKTVNSKKVKDFWQGEIEGADKSFKTFKNMFWGYRAMFITLTSYLKKGFNTIDLIVNRYAPAEDNNHPESYASTVSRQTGIARNKIIQTDEELKKIIAAMSYVENGVAANELQINEGYKLFKTA